MKQDKKSDNQRKVDKNIKKSFQKVSSGFSLVSNVDIQAWKAYLVIFFVAGFFASLIWGAYSTWYLNTKASATATMYTLTTNQAHRAGENFQTQILLDTSSQNIVAVQAVATFDPTLVTISSLDNSVSDFPNELAKNVDSQNHKIF
ncbi:MAG TPA: hypothetical protein VK254_00825, partial [Candidatus Bathyarchaeia archaeon]|nr:hypothetical protein [Candidatus Bathyarchaeia archaeon]